MFLKKNFHMHIRKSSGTTPSERRLSKLAESTFLGFWSFANPFRDQGGPKEVCDLLVVCGRDVIIFSDKSCILDPSSDISCAWLRWYRRAVSESIKQSLGAERWIRQHPDRLFIDRKLDRKLPVNIDRRDQIRFHHCILAMGARDACKGAGSRRGSLTLEAPMDAGAATSPDNLPDPFVVQQHFNHDRMIHIFDDVTLPKMLTHLSTICDFLEYLKFKEGLFRQRKVGRIYGEENLLAMFLSEIRNSDHRTPFINGLSPDTSLEIADGGWSELLRDESYHVYRAACKGSEVWDRIINQFAFHAFDGSLVEVSPQTVEENEVILRTMALEPRRSRIELVFRMMERWKQCTDGVANTRVVKSPSQEGVAYVFTYFPRVHASPEVYREERQLHLKSYTMLILTENPSIKRAVGIATEAGDEQHRTFDVATIDQETGPATQPHELRKIRDALGLPPRTAMDSLSERSRVRTSPRHKGCVPRNALCPCGSGRKFKKCCRPRVRTDIGDR
ncbi:YecA family protein [Rhodopirellula baltica]|uniref:Similar to preprotein translocase SecA chain n=1 Tax=Rhodopirellula baltica (strain DSM 10527 / NCIMB 13988 / SH1) TaxID=243090 RepID=Q7UE30_RHOBA|nr:SEC-C domain-containing protein [Rhodopirellula baltica]CAD79222.1 similar to preprotein translocase SecA chain [Rhodopirellula baltica SH 1]